MKKTWPNSPLCTAIFTGEAQPPPHNSTAKARPHSKGCAFAAGLRSCGLAVALLALAMLCAPASSAAEANAPPPAASARKLPLKNAPPKKSAKKSKTPHADVWAFSSQQPRPVDQIWTRGMAPQALKQAAVTGLKNKALKSEIKAPSVPTVTPPNTLPATGLGSQEKQLSGVLLNKNARIHGDIESMSSSWHNSSFKNDKRIDQEITRQETNVYGAYADIEASEDLTVRAGPEISHTRTQNSTQHSNADSTSLGLGLQLKWGF
ncbi:MAG: hypothetical protein RRY29_01020 [Desulfovibrionaceae bacterium]